MTDNILRILPPPRDSWDRLPGEGEIAYAGFLHWLLEKPRSDASAIVFASQYNWAERARAYDAKQKSSGRPKDLLAATFQMLLQLVHNEVNALLKRALESPEGVGQLTVKEVTTILECLMTHPEVLASGIEMSSNVNLKDASLEEIHKLQEARKIMQRLRSA